MIGINAADIVRQLRRRLGIRGDANMALDESVIPTLTLADLEAAPYNAKGGGIGYQSLAGVAAQFTVLGWGARVTNVQAGFSAVMRKMFLWASAPTDVVIGLVPEDFLGTLGGAYNGGNFSWDSIDTNDGATLTAGALRASLYPFQYSALAVLFTTAAIMPWFRLPLTATPQLLELPFCIRHRSVLVVQAVTANIGLFASSFWDEYQPE